MNKVCQNITTSHLQRVIHGTHLFSSSTHQHQRRLEQIRRIFKAFPKSQNQQQFLFLCMCGVCVHMLVCLWVPMCACTCVHGWKPRVDVQSPSSSQSMVLKEAGPLTRTQSTEITGRLSCLPGIYMDSGN